MKIGDEVVNDASIYFDYNFPVVTDPYITKFDIISNTTDPYINGWQVFPNPVSSNLEVQFDDNMDFGDLVIELVSASGEVLSTKQLLQNTNKTSFDMKSLGSGLYFVKVIGEGVTGVSKVLKVD